MQGTFGDRSRILVLPAYRYHFLRKARKDHQDRGLFENNPSPFTPEFMVKEMVSRAQCAMQCDGQRICDENIRVLVLFTLEVAVQLIAEGCKSHNITVATREDCGATRRIAESMGCNYTTLPTANEKNLKEEEQEMKFHLVIGNPPYQKEKGTRSSIWQDFVNDAARMLEDDGKLAMIHPSGWRSVGRTKTKSMSEARETLKSMDMEWLSINGIKHGQRDFGVSSRYDMYVARKRNTPGFLTEVNDEKGKTTKECIKDMKFIPNWGFDQVLNLLSGGGEGLLSCSMPHLIIRQTRRLCRKRKLESTFIPVCTQ